MKCLLYKWRLSRALDRDEAPSVAVDRHLNRCPSCRRLYDMHLALKETPAMPREEVSSALHNRIMASLETTPSTSSSHPSAWAWAGAALALMVGLLWFTRPVPSQPPAPGLADVSVIQEAVSAPLTALAESPEAEYERIKSDIRSAADYLFARL